MSSIYLCLAGQAAVFGQRQHPIVRLLYHSLRKINSLSVFAKFFCRLSQNSLSAVSFFWLLQHSRPLVLMHHLSYWYLRAAPEVLIHERRMSKNKYIYFFHPSFMDRCFASARRIWFLLWWCISTTAWRLLVQTCCQKSEKTTADSSDNARAADLQRKETMIFREVIYGRTIGMIVPSPGRLWSDCPP